MPTSLITHIISYFFWRFLLFIYTNEVKFCIFCSPSIVTWWKMNMMPKYKRLTVLSLLFLCLALIFLISVTMWVYKVWGDRGKFFISRLCNNSMQHLRICNNSKNRIALQNSQTFRKSLSWQRSSSKNSPRRLVGLTRSLFLKRMRALQNVWKKLQKVIRLENRSSKVKGTLCNLFCSK